MKKILGFILGVVIILLFTPNQVFSAESYQLIQTVPVYPDSQSALNRTGSSGTYPAGAYSIFTTASNGMLNITKTEGTAGAWINPAENGDSAGATYRLATAQNGLNLRSGAGTSYGIILKIPYKAKVELIQAGTSWSKVRYAGESGYVSSAYLGPVDSPASYPIYLTTASVNFRSGPGSSYLSYALLPRGTKVQYISGGTWSKVIHNGKTGYIHSSYLSPEQAEKVTTTPYVTTASVNFRSGPGTGYPSLGLLSKGTEVGLISSSGSWAKVVYGGKTGYISSSYLSAQTAASVETKPYLTRTSVNFRTGPGTSYASIRLLASGTEVGLISTAASWSKVVHEGKTGYIASSYLMPKTLPDPDAPRIGIAWSGSSSPDKYTAAVAAAGGQAVLLPRAASLSEAQAALKGADALLLIGGGDISASYYGQQDSPLIERVDPARDASEYWTLRAALEQDLPILAVCRGLQWLNVIRGGTLYQDIPTEYGSALHRDPERKSTVYHDIVIEPDTKLAAILGSGRLSVDSLHHQAISKLGEGLTPSARSDDGLIEAVEATDKRFVVGVQFHPENLYAKGSTLFLNLFKRLVSEAR